MKDFIVFGQIRSFVAITASVNQLEGGLCEVCAGTAGLFVPGVFPASVRVKGCECGSVFLSAQSAETCKLKGIEM